MNKDIIEKVTFCSGCFSTNEDGSWGNNGGWTVEDVERGQDCYCMNCAGHGEVVVMSRYSSNRIRQNASWVGKRYYPHEEDFWNEIAIRVGKWKTFFIRYKKENVKLGRYNKIGVINWMKKTQ